MNCRGSHSRSRYGCHYGSCEITTCQAMKFLAVPLQVTVSAAIPIFLAEQHSLAIGAAISSRLLRRSSAVRWTGLPDMV